MEFKKLLQTRRQKQKDGQTRVEFKPQMPYFYHQLLAKKNKAQKNWVISKLKKTKNTRRHLKGKSQELCGIRREDVS
jgi:hypothetical protein